MVSLLARNVVISALGSAFACGWIAGCSVFSGVSDLQSGPQADETDAGARDSSPPSTQKDASVPDTSVPDTSTPPDTGTGTMASCGNMKCAPNVPCCVDLTSSAKACADNGGCHGASVAFSCTNAGDCGKGEVCCLSIKGGSSCEAACGITDQSLCDPNNEHSCPDGQQCKPEPVIGGFSTCRGG